MLAQPGPSSVVGQQFCQFCQLLDPSNFARLQFQRVRLGLWPDVCVDNPWCRRGASDPELLVSGCDGWGWQMQGLLRGAWASPGWVGSSHAAGGAGAEEEDGQEEEEEEEEDGQREAEAERLQLAAIDI